MPQRVNHGRRSPLTRCVITPGVAIMSKKKSEQTLLLTLTRRLIGAAMLAGDWLGKAADEALATGTKAETRWRADLDKHIDAGRKSADQRARSLSRRSRGSDAEARVVARNFSSSSAPMHRLGPAPTSRGVPPHRPRATRPWLEEPHSPLSDSLSPPLRCHPQRRRSH